MSADEDKSKLTVRIMLYDKRILVLVFYHTFAYKSCLYSSTPTYPFFAEKWVTQTLVERIAPKVMSSYNWSIIEYLSFCSRDFENCECELPSKKEKVKYLLHRK